MRTTAGGGTGKTPPGTGCNPGAVMRKKSQKLENVLVERREKRLGATYEPGGVVGRGSSG